MRVKGSSKHLVIAMVLTEYLLVSIYDTDYVISENLAGFSHRLQVYFFSSVSLRSKCEHTRLESQARGQAMCIL